MLNRRSFLVSLLAFFGWKPEPKSNIIFNGSVGIDPNPDAVEFNRWNAEDGVVVPVFKTATMPIINFVADAEL
jgi:hypothetical protein